MRTTSKLAVGLSLASGALLAAWLLTGDRKVRTKQIVVKSTENLRKVLKTEEDDKAFDESEIYYI